MNDYYKILNLNLGASETEIKKRFHKLAIIYHPDKNEGSKKSEETFKIILEAYEVLSDRNKRIAYDLKYKQYFYQPQNAANNQYQTRTNTENKQDQNKSQDRQRTNKRKYYATGILKINYRFWSILVVVAMLYLYKSCNNITPKNIKYEEQIGEKIKKIEKQKPENRPENRPESGELEFKKQK